MPESPYPMIPVDEAIAIILREVHPLPAQSVPFAGAGGCVLAESVRAGDPL
ncbi:MAG: molybdopterin molybdenumtransferase MoeA, partial [Caldilineae bacterium]